MISDDYDSLDPWKRIERIPHLLSMIGSYLVFSSVLQTKLVSHQWKTYLSPSIDYEIPLDPKSAYILPPSIIKSHPHPVHVVGVVLESHNHVMDLPSIKKCCSCVGYLALHRLEKEDLLKAVPMIKNMFLDLTHLALRYCGNAWEILGEIGKCNKLEWLELCVPSDSYSCRGRDTIYPKWDTSVPVVLPHVKAVRMTDIGISELNQFVKYVLPGLPGLTSLSLKYSDTFAENIGKYCPNISYLHFNQPSLTDLGMSYILQLPKLKSLNCYCLNQGSWTGAIPPDVVNTSLEILELDSMCSVKSILPIARACPNLKEFSASYITLLKPEETNQFMKKLPLLKKFVLNKKIYK